MGSIFMNLDVIRVIQLREVNGAWLTENYQNRRSSYCVCDDAVGCGMSSWDVWWCGDDVDTPFWGVLACMHDVMCVLSFRMLFVERSCLCASWCTFYTLAIPFCWCYEGVCVGKRWLDENCVKTWRCAEPMSRFRLGWQSGIEIAELGLVIKREPRIARARYPVLPQYGADWSPV